MNLAEDNVEHTASSRMMEISLTSPVRVLTEIERGTGCQREKEREREKERGRV